MKRISITLIFFIVLCVLSFADNDLIVHVNMGDNAKSVAEEILSTRKDVTAIFTTNDHLAYDVMLACKEIGKNIPEDVSLIGFDDTLLGPHRIGEILSVIIIYIWRPSVPLFFYFGY